MNDDMERDAEDEGVEAGSADSFYRDSKRESVAGALDNVASRLHEKADAGGERVIGIGHGAAEKVEATAQYVREHGPREMLSDVEAFAKKHPGKSLLAVAVVGFLAGRALRRD
jgi:hypothetical protein